MTANGNGEGGLDPTEAQRYLERLQRLVEKARGGAAAPVTPPRAPRTVDIGSVDPASPGHRWWQYRRMSPSATTTNGHRNGSTENGARASSQPREAAAPDAAADRAPPASPSPPSPPSRADDGDINLFPTEPPSGVGYFVLGAAIIIGVAVATQLHGTRQGAILVPLAGLLLAVAAGRHIVRRHPDEPWMVHWLVAGTIAKLAACYLHYYNVTVTYNGVADATGYDSYGREFATAWLRGGVAPVLPNLRETNFVSWFTGVVYYVFGANLITGTFVYGLLGLIGSYLWYRATVDAVPIVNKKLYLAFVLFAPSIVFWPALISKEALMQLGLGTMALGAAFLFRQRFSKGLLIALPGSWLVWVVRPHLLALVAIAVGFAYLAGRVRRSGRKAGILSRPVGIIIVALLVTFTIGQAASFLGLNSISASSIQSELDQQTQRSDYGGSSFNNGGNSLNPIYLPRDAVTVLVRPFPWEAGGGVQLLAALEGTAIAALLVWRFKSLRVALARSREMPFLMFCWVLTGLYAVAFSSFANFGLLVRERSLVLPAVFVLVAVDPVLARARPPDEPKAYMATAARGG